MDRRSFLKGVAASSGLIFLGGNLRCGSPEQGIRVFPECEMPAKLHVIRIPENMSWHEKNFLTCFQGLINRNQARIYLVHTDQDRFWLEYYREAFGINYEFLDDPFQIVRRFADEIAGLIVYDPDMPHSLNLATTLGALRNAVPVSKNLVTQLADLNLAKLDDTCGRWQDLYQAYDWGLQELLPKCNQQIIAQLCVHDPYWITSTYLNRDYVIAHKIFSFDLSASERDKLDYPLIRKIYCAYPAGAIVIGWHCIRDKEHEAIALSSEFGHFGMCSLHTPNLTVHSSIRLPEGKKFNQRSVARKELTVQDKVYIACMATDGDATWFVHNLVNTDWANALHGNFKYSWGFLPMAYDLMPGMVQYYLENMTPNDFFVAGPSGATYTYPHLHPDPGKFFRLTRAYMEKCGLTTVHLTNWNDRDWWQEVELPGYHDLLRKKLPGCIGYVRGMGESAFEKHYIAGGKPYIFCGEGIHRGSDIFQTMKDFIDACPNRPLFIFNLVNHTIPMDHIKEAMDKLPEGTVELVHVDELLLLVDKAYQEGKITGELYPEKSGLRKILAQEAQQAWPKFMAELEGFQQQYAEGEAAYIDHIRTTPIGLEKIVTGDLLAFTTIWHCMNMVKLALESKGVYVNHKPTATRDFITEFNNLKDVAIVEDLQKLWSNWHHETVTFAQAKDFAERLYYLSRQLNNSHPI